MTEQSNFTDELKKLLEDAEETAFAPPLEVVVTAAHPLLSPDRSKEKSLSQTEIDALLASLNVS